MRLVENFFVLRIFSSDRHSTFHEEEEKKRRHVYTNNPGIDLRV